MRTEPGDVAFQIRQEQAGLGIPDLGRLVPGGSDHLLTIRRKNSGIDDV